MNRTSGNNSLKGISRIAGISYLMIIVAGIVSQFAIRGSLINPDDAEATVRNIMDAETLFRASIAGDIVMLTFDVIVGVALFMLFRATSPVEHPGDSVPDCARRCLRRHAPHSPRNRRYSQRQQRAHGPRNSSGAKLRCRARPRLLAGADFFAVSLAMVGYLALKSGAVPSLIGVLLMFAGAGYMLDSFAQSCSAITPTTKTSWASSSSCPR